MLFHYKHFDENYYFAFTFNNLKVNGIIVKYSKHICYIQRQDFTN